MSVKENSFMVKNEVFGRDRRLLSNPHAMFVGVPGSGKTFSAKKDIRWVLGNTDDAVLIFPRQELDEYVNDDPYRGGSIDLPVVKIDCNDENSLFWINPFDIVYNENTHDISYSYNEVSDTLFELYKIVAGEEADVVEKSLMDKAVKIVFEPFETSLQLQNKTHDYENNPTFKEINIIINRLALYDPRYQDFLAKWNDKFAPFAKLLERKTSMPENERLIISSDQYPGHLEIHERIWSKIFDLACIRYADNKMWLNSHDYHIHTWIYFEEADHLCNYLFERMYKKARPKGGVITSIFQSPSNIEDEECWRQVMMNTRAYKLFCLSTMDVKFFSKAFSRDLSILRVGQQYKTPGFCIDII